MATDFFSAAAVGASVTAAVEAIGGIDQFVYAWYPDELTATTTFTDVSEEEWARAARAHWTPRGGWSGP